MPFKYTWISMPFLHHMHIAHCLLHGYWDHTPYSRDGQLGWWWGPHNVCTGHQGAADSLGTHTHTHKLVVVAAQVAYFHYSNGLQTYSTLWFPPEFSEKIFFLPLFLENTIFLRYLSLAHANIHRGLCSYVTRSIEISRKSQRLISLPSIPS